MKNKYILFILIIFAIVSGTYFYRTKLTFSHLHKTESHKHTKYNCPMHPTYISDKPGTCPICGMDLVPMEDEKDKEVEKESNKKRKIKYYRNPMNPQITSPVPMKDEMGMDYIPVYEDEEEEMKDKSVFKVSPNRIQEIGVKLEQAKYRNLIKHIYTYGTVAYDPELYHAQQELISAINSYKKIAGKGYQESEERAKRLIDAARLKLHLMGISDEYIKEIEKSGKPDISLLSSDYSDYVWVYSDIYEIDSKYIKKGQKVTVYTKNIPNKKFYGYIDSVDPVFNSKTRTVKARIKINNSQKLLKPEMYVDVDINMPLGLKLSVSRDSVVDSGINKFAFVYLGDGKISVRNVETGDWTDNYVEIVKGIKEGEQVITSANFLIDSESKIKAAVMQMN